jgi:hypothetical protein
LVGFALLYHIYLTASVGKSTFLDYLLAWEASKGNRVIYWVRRKLYIFDGLTVYHLDNAAALPDRLSNYSDALCLVDTSESHPLPDSLLQNNILFVVQAASPNPHHKK